MRSHAEDQAHTATSSARLRGCGQCARLAHGERASGLAVAREHHAAADRGRSQGRQGDLVYLGRPARWPKAISKAFEAKFPGIAVRVERTGAERVFQRIGQERASNIFACDVAQSSDAAHYIAWKREGALTAVRA